MTNHVPVRPVLDLRRLRRGLAVRDAAGGTGRRVRRGAGQPRALSQWLPRGGEPGPAAHPGRPAALAVPRLGAGRL